MALNEFETSFLIMFFEQSSEPCSMIIQSTMNVLSAEPSLNYMNVQVQVHD